MTGERRSEGRRRSRRRSGGVLYSTFAVLHQNEQLPDGIGNGVDGGVQVADDVLMTRQLLLMTHTHKVLTVTHYTTTQCPYDPTTPEYCDIVSQYSDI